MKNCKTASQVSTVEGDGPVTITIPGTPEKRHQIPAPPDAAGAVGDYRPIEDRRGTRKVKR